MDINAIVDAAADPAVATILQSGVRQKSQNATTPAPQAPADWFTAKAEDPYKILDTVEFKTAWHPIGV